MKKISKSILILTSLFIFSCQAPGSNNQSPSPSASGNPSASPSATTPPAAAGFSFVSVDTDKVISGGEVKTDGVKDLHFTYTHNFAKETQIVSVSIVRLENGNPGRAGWDTPLSLYWILGVEADGKALNTKDIADLGAKLNGNVKFDFYGSQSGAEASGLTKPGTEYQLDITVKADDPTKTEIITEKVKI